MLRNHSKCVVPVDTFIPFRGGYDLFKWIHFHSSCTILKKKVSREGGRKASRRNLLETKKIRGRHTYGEGPLYKYIIKVVFEGQAFFSTVSFEKLKHLESAPRGEPLEPGVTYIRNFASHPFVWPRFFLISATQGHAAPSPRFPNVWRTHNPRQFNEIAACEQNLISRNGSTKSIGIPSSIIHHFLSFAAKINSTTRNSIFDKADYMDYIYPENPAIILQYTFFFFFFIIYIKSLK